MLCHYLMNYCLRLRPTIQMCYSLEWNYFEGPQLSSNSHTSCLTNTACQNLHQTYLLEVDMTQILAYRETLYYNVSHRNMCKLFVHDNFSGTLNLHQVLVWSKLGQSRPFRPMRDLIMRWSRAFNLMCEVALIDLAPLTPCRPPQCRFLLHNHTPK